MVPGREERYSKNFSYEAGFYEDYAPGFAHSKRMK